jgi:serine/threonine protein kinase
MQLSLTAELALLPVPQPSFMAPEVHKKKPYDTQADVFSAGCTFFELMTLEPAY